MFFRKKNKITNRLSAFDLIKLSLRVFRAKPLRTTLTVLGMALGIGAVLILVSLGYGLQYILIGRLVTTEDSLKSLEVFYPPEANLNITLKNLDVIKNIPGVEEISPIAELTGEIKFKEVSGLALFKIINQNYFRLSGLLLDVGQPLASQEEKGIVASSQTLKLVDLPSDESSLGKEFSLKIFYPQGESGEVEELNIKESFLLRGIVKDDLQPPFILFPSQFFPKEPPFFSAVWAKAKNINLLEPVRDSLIENGFVISARIDLVKQAKKIMNIITIVLGVFGVASLVISAIGMFNTMVVGFLERIYEVGIIKSLGATDKDVRNLFLAESMIMGFAGGLGGIILGVGTGKLFNFGLGLLAQRLGGKAFDLFIAPPWFLIIIFVSSILIGVISGLWPAKRAAQLSPKEAFLGR